MREGSINVYRACFAWAVIRSICNTNMREPGNSAWSENSQPLLYSFSFLKREMS